MLRTSPAARFASNVSPLREQREAYFAHNYNPHQNDSTNPPLAERAKQELLQEHFKKPTAGSSIFGDIEDSVLMSAEVEVLAQEDREAAETVVRETLSDSVETVEQVLRDASIFTQEKLDELIDRLHLTINPAATPLEKTLALQGALMADDASTERQEIIGELVGNPQVTASVVRDLHRKLAEYCEVVRIIPNAEELVLDERARSSEGDHSSTDDQQTQLRRVEADLQKFERRFHLFGGAYGALKEQVKAAETSTGGDAIKGDTEALRREYVQSLQKRIELVGNLLHAQVKATASEHVQRLQHIETEFGFTGDAAQPLSPDARRFTDISSFAIDTAIADRKKRLYNTIKETRARPMPSMKGAMTLESTAFLKQSENVLSFCEQELEQLKKEQVLLNTVDAVDHSDEHADPLDAKKNILFAQEIADQRFFDQWVREMAPQVREILETLPTWPQEAQEFVREQGYLEMLESVLAFDEVKDAETADGRRAPRGCVEPVPVSVRQQEGIRKIVAFLQFGDPHLLLEGTKRLEPKTELENETIDTLRAAEDLEQRRHGVEARLSAQLQHPVADELDVKTILRSHYERIENAIRQLRGHEDGSGRMTGPAAQEIRADTEILLEDLEACALQLENIRIKEPENDAYQPIGGNSNGVYRASERTYYINATKLRDRYPDPAERAYARDRLLEHERGHAILHILQTTVCPTLLFDMRAALSESTASAHPPTDEEIVNIAARNNWGIGREAYDRLLQDARKETPNEDIARKAAIRPFLDELINKYISWKSKGRPSVNQETWELFSALDARTPPKEKKTILYDETLKLFDTDDDPSAIGDPRFQNQVVDAAPSGVRDVSDQVNRRRDERTGEEDEQSSGDPAVIDQQSASTEDTGSDIFDPTLMIDETRRNVQAIEKFLQAYPEYTDQFNTYLYEPNDLKLKTQQIDDIYRKGHYYEKSGRKVLYPRPESNPAYQEAVKKVHAFAKEINKLAKGVDEEKANLTNIPPETAMGFKGLWNSIRWLSVLDIIKIAQDTKEDYLDMWRRAQQRKTSDVEYALAQWIPDNVPYLGMFKHYFDRRANQAELDDVQKWQNAFQNKDYYQLRDGLKNTPNQDQLKAIMNLLAQSGHINWSDENLWNSLSQFSKYRIPIEPCRRDTNLRDEYLQKLITDIWNDKDLYVTWKNQNDNAINSKKSEFNTTVDAYANAGSMGSKLKIMLETYHEYTYGAKKGDSMPPFVNEHHFEEILHYAMRVGKMSMEDKIFYLIQGVRYGLLPVERLQVMGGEKLGLLSAFPFLEFFYQKNNTLPEVRAMGQALDEEGDLFTPGLKTTLFIRMVLLRDANTRIRIKKAGNRRGEGFDHEDMPYLLTDIDHGFLKNITGNINAGQQKLSPQSMQNAYVGFNEKFKVLAKLVELEDRGIGRFTDQDAEDMAITLATYVQFDNMITKWGTEQNRGYLSPAELDNEVPPAGKFVTREYRNRTRDFVNELTQNLGIESASGKGQRVPRDDLIASANRDSTLPPGDTKYQLAVFEATDDLVKQLKSKILADRGQILKNTLRHFEQRAGFLYTKSEGLDKAGADSKMNTDNVQQSFLTLTRGLGQV